MHALELKKYRKANGEFIGEGPKLIMDLLSTFHCTYLAGSEKWMSANHAITDMLNKKQVLIDTVTEEELRRASLLQHPQDVIAVFKQPSYIINKEEIGKKTLCLALDGVQDPGNLGTIVRIADWFGIEDIFCSPLTADIYNPKSVQATMGSMARVRMHYLDLKTLFEHLSPEIPIYGTLLDGKDLYQQPLSGNGIIVMGNEGNGISPELRKMITRKLLIPNYPQGRKTAESLNVAIATAVICAEFRRQFR